MKLYAHVRAHNVRKGWSGGRSHPAAPRRSDMAGIPTTRYHGMREVPFLRASIGLPSLGPELWPHGATIAPLPTKKQGKQFNSDKRVDMF